MICISWRIVHTPKRRKSWA